MLNRTHYSIDEDTISKVGLHISDKLADAHIPPNARVFEYPWLKNVFIMESDLYGNIMPENSCFLAFYGRYGYKGKFLRVETLRNASIQDIKRMVETDFDA